MSNSRQAEWVWSGACGGVMGRHPVSGRSQGKPDSELRQNSTWHSVYPMHLSPGESIPVQWLPQMARRFAQPKWASHRQVRDLSRQGALPSCFQPDGLFWLAVSDAPYKEVVRDRTWGSARCGRARRRPKETRRSSREWLPENGVFGFCATGPRVRQGRRIYDIFTTRAHNARTFPPTLDLWGKSQQF